MILNVNELPAPECEGGYPWAQIERFMDPQQVKRLALWMDGQTQMLCDGRRYDHDTKTHHTACGGVAHGPVVYPWDLQRFIRAEPVID